MDDIIEKKKVGRPPSRKKLLTLRLEQEIVDFYRELGRGSEHGWLQGVNDTLKRAMQKRISRGAHAGGARRESLSDPD